ncbi:MAG TPA: hypothetical protein VFA19_09130 [Gaiellaceae bacterium]|nr:hypothetical protein [Gaiellaceae bacterium]
MREAASASSLDQRAWTLVRTAAALRRAGSYDEAIAVLEDVIALRPSWEVERAALTCAVSTHCDAGDPLLAVRIGSSAAVRGADAILLGAFGRANAEAYSATNDVTYRLAADACFRNAAALDAQSSVARA